MKITDRKTLEKWLEQNSWFEDGYIVKIDRKTPTQATLKVGYQIEGNYEAGESQVLMEYEIAAQNISKWTLTEIELRSLGTDFGIIGIEISKSNIGLTIESFIRFEFECSMLAIGKPNIIHGFTQPWLSDTAIFIRILNYEIPKPDYWIVELKKRGFDLSFRYFAGTVKKVEEIPYPDYAGYYLQFTKRIDSTDEGIFFSSVTKDGHITRISIELKDEKMQKVWKTLLLLIADWNNVVVSRGNVTFHQIEWINFLNNGKYPDRIEKILSK